MKNILVPVGSSKNAESHLKYAIDFAKTFGAKLYVIQIFNIKTKAGTLIKVDHLLERESLAFLKAHVEKVDTKGVEVVVKTFRGKLIETLELVCKTTDIDLILIVKQTNIPALIVPENFKFTPIDHILIALKSAVIKKEDALDPLIALKKQFNSKIDLLLVETSFHNKGDFEVNEEFASLVNQTSYYENPTTFQGVLENCNVDNPDLLCVVRRKRGFFTKIWDNNTILKKDFNSSKLPVLVLSGLK